MIRTLLITTVLAAIAAASPANAAIVGVQAEDGVASSLNGATFNFVADVTALGGQYATVSADGGGSPAGVLTLSVNLAADSYDLWVKIKSASDGDDSFYAPADESGLTSGGNDFDAPSVNVNNLHNIPTESDFVWVLVNGNAGGAGDYGVTTGGAFSFVINGREDGLLIDAFAFVSESEGIVGEAVGGDTNATSAEAAILDAAFATVEVPTPAALPAGLALVGLIAARRRRMK